MRTKRLAIFHALVDGKIALPSLTPLSLKDLRRYHWFDENSDWSVERVSCDVPFETGRLQMWDGSDGAEWPHVHYSCRHCGDEHNFDVDDDTSPRIHICSVGGKMELYTLVEWGDS